MHDTLSLNVLEDWLSHRLGTCSNRLAPTSGGCRHLASVLRARVAAELCTSVDEALHWAALVERVLRSHAIRGLHADDTEAMLSFLGDLKRFLQVCGTEKRATVGA